MTTPAAQTPDDALAAARLLGIDPSPEPAFERLRCGLRSRAVLATLPGVGHRLRARRDRVVVKLYRGRGDTPGSREYQRYHRDDFAALPALASLAAEGRIQPSLDGGVRDGVGPYAVLGFVPGEELATVLERAELDGAAARRLADELLARIWIPLWAAGLRFKDCHPGNFVVTPDGAPVMIDTEQMRKPARELLAVPKDRTRRDAAEAAALRRLPGLLKRIVLATGPRDAAAAVDRGVREALSEARLPDALRALGRDPGADAAARRSVAALLEALALRGWLR